MPEALNVYIPIDRQQALARGEPLPDRTGGTALFADISGFTPLTEALARTFGPRRGSEELTRQLNRVYDAVIEEVNRFGGSVISFAGDAITCWFDQAAPRPSLRAAACALAMQAAMQALAQVPLPDGTTVRLGIKIAVASGPARRFLIGDPAIQRLDTLAGETLARMVRAEHLAREGEIVVDEATFAQLGEALQAAEWRTDPETGERFARTGGLSLPLSEVPQPVIPQPPLSDAQAGAWLLPPVYERLREGLGEFLTELRPAVALFLRFEGIDYDADDAAAAKLDDFIRWAQTVLAQYDGSLLQLTIGDKGSYFYAAFGAPLAHEDDTRRAVSAALELRQPPDELGFVRSVQIGIAQGVFRAGGYGGRLRRTYGVLGDEVNLAARLMQHAGPGEVLVGSHVQRAAGEDFTWEVLPPIQVKGKREPVKISRLVGRRQGRAEAVRYTGRLVGREAELEHLTRFLQPIFQGRFAGLMYVYGEPGMGKSRLVYELRQQLSQTHPVSWLTLPAEGILRQPLNPLQYYLREYFGLDGDSLENKITFEGVLKLFIAELQSAEFADRPGALDLAAELDRTRSFLGALAGGLRWEGSLYEQVEPRLRLENTLTACKTLILAESLQRPVVLLVEDAHALDGDTEAFLAVLTRNVERYPLAVMLASRYRDDGSRYAVTVDAGTPQSSIDLNQLSPDGVRAMAAQVLGGEVDDELAAFLNDKTSGNPFFVEQLALDLRERGLLSMKAAPTGAGQPPVAVVSIVDRARIEEVPASINAVLIARLDRLAAQVKAVVQTAAVLGHEFEVLVLSQMLRDDARLPQRVRQAETEAIWSALSETRYLFKHALLRDAAYDMQLHERLRELHALAGAALEQVFAEDLGSQAAPLAYHWAKAGNPAKEAKYSALAGEQALRISAFRDALRYFQRALTLYDSNHISDDDVTPARLNYGLGEAQVGLGELREAQRYFQISLDLARAQGDRNRIANALSYLGGVTLRLGEVEQAEAILQEALLVVREIQDQRALSTILNRLGHIADARGENAQAIQFYEESLALARAIGDPVTMAIALNALGVVGLRAKTWEAARRYFEEAQTFFKATGNRAGVLMTLGNLGMVVSGLGQYVEAKQRYQEALTLSLEIGDRWMRGALLDSLGDVTYTLGDDTEAARNFGESLRLVLEVGAIPSALLALAGIAKFRVRAGNPDQALELLGLVLHHPACDDETRQRAEPLLAELRAVLPPEVVEAALERGRARTVEEVAAEILGTG